MSSLTLAGVAKEPHRVKYSVIEERTLVFFDSESMERATRNIENDISDRVTAAKERVAGLDGQVKKLTKLILNDDHPSSSLVAQLKRHERELIEAVIALESLNALAARETVVRAMPSRAELLRPEVRRAVRKELARLFVKIDVHRDFVLCWADDRSAYGIYLDPAKKGFFHDLDGRIFAA